MNKGIKFLFAAMLLFGWSADAFCATDVTGFLKDALKTLGIQKGSPNLCVLTDASYIRLAGETTEKYVDVIQRETGCSVGEGNLLLVHRPSNYDLLMVLYRRDTQECVVIRHDGQEGRAGKLQIGDEHISKRDFWKKARKGVIGPDTYSIVTILSTWSLGAPYDFLKSAEIHGHVCPGLVWGYFTSKSIQKRYPLKEGEKYVFIACPNACKDDAIQVLLDVTPGKKTLFVKKLTEDQERQVPTGKKVGIVVKWNRSRKKGKGAVLVLDMNKINKTIGIKKASKPQEKANLVPKLIPHLNSSEDFIKVIQEFNVTPEIMEGLKSAGQNPYEVIKLKEWLVR